MAGSQLAIPEIYSHAHQKLRTTPRESATGNQRLELRRPDVPVGQSIPQPKPESMDTRKRQTAAPQQEAAV
ncbi:MAG: hypothetical protein ACJAR2_004289 [Ilumatobacter sp.]